MDITTLTVSVDNAYLIKIITLQFNSAFLTVMLIKFIHTPLDNVSALMGCLILVAFVELAGYQSITIKPCRDAFIYALITRFLREENVNVNRDIIELMEFVQLALMVRHSIMLLSNANLT
jgi:hypothetical protein